MVEVFLDALAPQVLGLAHLGPVVVRLLEVGLGGDGRQGRAVRDVTRR